MKNLLNKEINLMVAEVRVKHQEETLLESVYLNQFEILPLIYTYIYRDICIS